MTTSRNHHRSRTILLSASAGVTLFGAVAIGSLGGDADRKGPAPIVQVHDLSDVGDWARESGLTGLSPASVGQPATPTADRYAEQNALLAELADWARANNLTGLSPASLHPVAD